MLNYFKKIVMEAKIRVHGKSQSRTALGIINAYLKLYPNSTLSDLHQAFPHSLNPKSFTENLIVPVSETEGNEKMFFEKEDELIVLKNGMKYALVELWQKEHFDAICEHALQYGIVVAEIEETKPFEKGSYELEYLNGFILPEEIAPALQNEKQKCKCKCSWWWWILLLLLLLFLLFCLKKCYCCKNECSASAKTEVAALSVTDPTDNIKGSYDADTDRIIYDTGDMISLKMPDGTEWEIGQNSTEYKLVNFLNSDDVKVSEDKSKDWITLDNLHFETGTTNLTPESEGQLQNIANILKLFPNAHLKLGGYTDNTGTDEINMPISTERARVAAEKLIALGIDSDRVTYEGYGSKHPVCPANDTDFCRAANRRVDVRVTQK